MILRFLQSLHPLILSLHVLFCVLMILVVLIQSGKGAGFSGLFGGGGSDAVFSAPSGSMFIRKVTTGLAVGFFLTSFTLTYLKARQVPGVLGRSELAIPAPTAPAVPEAPATAAPAETPPAKK
jgi:preprotein translocase subunit SecG